MPKPLLSIGIIFKNEIRCLERCLASLTPLREAVPCELIVADTGSDDGSREIAEKYADVVFDFPWINDFSAARNAVMDRCSGRWYLTLDADEWLDSDIKELTTFLRSNNRKDLDVCSVLIRNYAEIDDFTEYNDFLTIRMLRMSTGIRYEGAVHEMWRGPDDGFVNKTLSHTILHHDGYVGLNEDVGRAKRQRNQALLEELLKEDPDNVRTLLQYIESSRPDPQHLDYLRRGLAAVEGKKEGWQAFGPPVYRYAVLAARNHNLPEEEEWTNRAVELFPDSFYSRIDIAFLAFIRCWENKRFKECIPWGEMYMAAIEDYDAGRGDQVALRVSTLLGASHQWRQKMYTSMAVACREEGQPGRAVELLEKVGLKREHYWSYPNTLSGGQKQRVGIARAIALDTKFVVLDESVSALDVSVQAQILQLLESLSVEKHLTYFFITHDLGVVKHFCDRILVMYLGNVCELADSNVLFHNPLHPYTQSLLAAVPRLRVGQEHSTESVLEGDVPSAMNPPKGCPFHTRCSRCMEICAHEKPPVVEVEPGHFVACHLFDL